MFGCYRIRTPKIQSLFVKALQKLPGIVTSFDKTEGERKKIKYFYRYENLRLKLKMYCFGRCRIKTYSQRVNALPFEKQVRHLDCKTSSCNNCTIALYKDFKSKCPFL